MSPTGRFDGFVRLPFDHPAQVLDVGIARLASAWQDYQAEAVGRGARRVEVIV
jgi:hypothetical protein